MPDKLPAAGMLIGAVIVQVLPGDSVPPAKVIMPVPVKDEPVPQILDWSPPDSAMPVSTLFKSTVKPMLVASAAASSENSIVNVAVAVLPGV